MSTSSDETATMLDPSKTEQVPAKLIKITAKRRKFLKVLARLARRILISVQAVAIAAYHVCSIACIAAVQSFFVISINQCQLYVYII